MFTGTLLAAALALGLRGQGVRTLDIALEGDDAASCLDEASLRSGISETLGASLGLPVGAVDATARIWVETVEGGFAARIEIVGATGSTRTRTLQTKDTACGELAAAVVLVSALLLDEVWAQERTLNVPALPAPVEPAPEKPRWLVFGGVSAYLSAGDLPGVAAGTGLRIEAAAPRVLAFGIGVRAWPLERVTDPSGVGAQFSAFEGEAFVCPRVLDRERLALAVCAGGRTGATYAAALGLDEGRAAVRPRVLADFGLGFRARLGGPVWLRTDVGAAVPLLRDRFTYEEGARRVQVHRAWPIVPTAGITLELRSEVRGPRLHVRNGSTTRH